MKVRRLVLGVTLLFMNFIGYSQADSSNSLATKVQNQEASEYSAWAKFLRKNLDSGVAASNGAPPGRYKVVVQFAIMPDGKLGDFFPLTEHGYGMEEELIRVLKKSPKWNPAYQDGQFVKVEKRQSVTFTTDGE